MEENPAASPAAAGRGAQRRLPQRSLPDHPAASRRLSGGWRSHRHRSARCHRGRETPFRGGPRALSWVYPPPAAPPAPAAAYSPHSAPRRRPDAAHARRAALPSRVWGRRVGVGRPPCGDSAAGGRAGGGGDAAEERRWVPAGLRRLNRGAAGGGGGGGGSCPRAGGLGGPPLGRRRLSALLSR